MKKYLGTSLLGVAAKTAATIGELMIPYILEHVIDHVVPEGDFRPVIFWGVLMILTALVVRWSNIFGNMLSVRVAKSCIQEMRQDLFVRTQHLSGSQIDDLGLPSLISRMTSDSYNIQNFISTILSMGIRQPIMLVGGIAVTLTMDAALASVLCVMTPILILCVIGVSRRGIPMYDTVQQRLDDVVRIMRENITGIRVVKALSKADYEKARFQEGNRRMTDSDLRASIVMAIPGPTVRMCLNLGLVLVVVLGAHRVNSGKMEPGVILAFLTYITMIINSIMALNRMFILTSKASASAHRIGEVLETAEDQPVLPVTAELTKNDGAVLEFDHVSFTHAAHATDENGAFAGEQRAKCLEDISFSLRPGQTLGIIGATGAGKTTIVNLLMRFYDANEGRVLVDGRDVRTYPKQALREKFGVVFQNDCVFAESLRDNISMGRDCADEAIWQAAEDAMAAAYIREKPGQLDYMADIKGANLSGGQKQRLFITRALVGDPEILILDDSSSALDYKTDAALRRNIRARRADAALIIVAQRVSSIMSADQILVLDAGRIIGCGRHEELLRSCAVYSDIYQSQMGDLA